MQRLAPTLGFLLLASGLAARAQPPQPADEACLACHRRGQATFPGGEGRAAPPVDTAAYALSPHRALGCPACHGGGTAGGHPGPGPPPAAVPCARCHGMRQFAERPVHAALLARADAPPCVACHVPHRMRPVAEWKPRVAVSVYCLTCHQRVLETEPSGGGRLQLTISDAVLGASVHLRHECPDCHAAYSRVDHPLREPLARASDADGASAPCRRCHPEQERLFAGGLHHRIRSIGHPSAPSCTDCHGYHAVASVLDLRLLAGTPCRRCHEPVFAAFAASRHAAAAPVGHPATPLCTSCHRAHDLDYGELAADANAVCRHCHPEAAAAHRGWLPQVERHFGAVACPACHAPPPGGRLAVTVYRVEGGRPLSPREVRAALGDTYAAVLEDRELAAPDLAAWGEMVGELNRREGRGRSPYALRVDAPEGVPAHRIGEAADACSACERCHEACLDLGGRTLPFGLR